MKRLGEGSTDAERAAEAALNVILDRNTGSVRYEPGPSAVMSPVHRGVDATSWRVVVDGRPGFSFLKVAADDLAVLPDSETTWRATAAAAALGLTPAPRGRSSSPSAILIDGLGDDWRVAHVDDLRDPTILARVVAAKRAFHETAPLGRIRDVFAEAAALAEKARERNVALPDDAEALLGAAARAGRAVRAAGVDLGPCHGDGVASNVMIGPDDAVQLVDFDEAGDADPLFDTAITLNEAAAFPAEFPTFLEATMGAAPSDALARCLLYAFADDLRWSLWGRIMDATSPRGGIEFLKYAQWRWLRCRTAAREAAFEQLPARV